MKIIKFIPKIALFLIVALLVLIRWFTGYQYLFSGTDETLSNTFEQYFDEVRIETVSLLWRTLRYVDMGNPDDQMIVLIHGAPWWINDFKNLLEDERLHTWYRIVVVDRLGYGRSELGHSEKSIRMHSDIIMELVQELDSNNETLPLIVGHSYGGSIALKISMDYADRISGALVVSWAVDPDHEKVFSISHVIKYQPLKFLIWPMLRVANDEKLSHVASLSNEVQWFDTITKPVIVLHGTSDSIVPYANAEYMQNNIPAEYMTLVPLEWLDHPIHFSHPELIVDEIITFITNNA